MKPDNTMKAAKTLVVRTEENKAELKSWKTHSVRGEGEGVSLSEPGMTRRGEEGELPGRLEQVRGLRRGLWNCICLQSPLNPDQCGRPGRLRRRGACSVGPVPALSSLASQMVVQPKERGECLFV